MACNSRHCRSVFICRKTTKPPHHKHGAEVLLFYQSAIIELHSEFIDLEIRDFGGDALAIDAVVRLRGEYEILK